MLTPRPYQKILIDNIRNSFRNRNRSVCAVLPTGGGKTICFTWIAAKSVSNGARVLILVHRDSLFKQTSKTLSKFNVRHGLIGAGYAPNYAHECQVAKIATFVRRLHTFTPDLIIVDECHHATAGQYRTVLNAFPNARVLGVTATPIRTDGTGLGEVFDDMIQGLTIQNLIDGGYLVEPTIYAPPTVGEIDVKRSGGDFNRKELSGFMDKPTITGDAVGHYTKLCPGVPAVAFCVSIQHAEHVRDSFRAAGYTSETVNGKMKQAEIDRVLNGLGNGSVQVVTSCDLISEGTDIPAIECAILLRPTMSTALFLQQVGRALRLSDGKTSAIVLDHVGNCARHGHPCADREWTLEGTKKRKRKNTESESVASVRICEDCFRAFAPAPECPSCGWIVPKRVRVVKEVAGELEKLEKKRIAKEKRMEVGRARTLEELKRIEKERNYSPGWAWNVFNSRKK
jgi:superfamily II DNA or RNA helicase